MFARFRLRLRARVRDEHSRLHRAWFLIIRVPRSFFIACCCGSLSDFGESIIVCLQNVTILGLVWAYDKKGPAHAAGVLAGFAGAVYAMAALVPPDLRWALTWVGSLASMMRWVPQAWTNFRNGHTGCLSSVTVALTVLGLAGRTWTYHQNGDAPMVRACATSLSLACVVLLQLVAYRGATRAHMARLAKEKKA